MTVKHQVWNKNQHEWTWESNFVGLRIIVKAIVTQCILLIIRKAFLEQTVSFFMTQIMILYDQLITANLEIFWKKETPWSFLKRKDIPDSFELFYKVNVTMKIQIVFWYCRTTFNSAFVCWFLCKSGGLVECFEKIRQVEFFRFNVLVSSWRTKLYFVSNSKKHGTFCLMKCFLIERVFVRIIQFLDCKFHASWCEKISVSIALHCLTRALQSFEEWKLLGFCFLNRVWLFIYQQLLQQQIFTSTVKKSFYRIVIVGPIMYCTSAQALMFTDNAFVFTHQVQKFSPWQYFEKIWSPG